MFEVTRIEVNRNPFIGLYFSASDEALLCSPSIPEKLIARVKAVLKPRKIAYSHIGQFYLSGLFSVLNSNGVLLPQFVEAGERKKIERDLSLRSACLDDRFSAVKNNVVANDKGALVNSDMQLKEVKKIADCLGVEVVKANFTGLKTVGAINAATNNGVFAFNSISQKDADLLEEVLKVKVSRGTTNLGAIANSYGIVANSHGALVGSLSSGFEVASVYQALLRE